jgi:hypothetical protein
MIESPEKKENKSPIVVVLSHVKSGTNARSPSRLLKLDQVTKQYGIDHIKVQSSDDIERALVRLSNLKQTVPCVIVVNGGDGTVDMVVNVIRSQRLFEIEPTLALLKGGTSNVIHRNIPLKSMAYKALDQIMRGQTDTCHIRPLKIQNKDDSNHILRGFFLGTGAIPRGILRTREKFHTKGLTGKLGETLSILGIIIRLFFKKDINDDAILRPSSLMYQDKKTEYIFWAVSSLKKLIPGVKTKASDKYMGEIFMGLDRAVKSSQQTTVDFTTDDPWVLDGEMQSPGNFTVSLDEPLEFLVSGSC